MSGEVEIVNRVVLSIFTVLLLFGIFIVPGAISGTTCSSEDILNSISLEEDYLPSVGPLDRVIRVAVYNEPNTTVPEYGAGGPYTNHYDILVAFLNDQGFSASSLTFQDILDHKLMTADFDVFVMANNLPRENITNYVNEFWLGGGAILSFDSALGYLYYHGMIYHEVKGDFGLFGAGSLEEWDYSFPSSIQVTTRHPTTKHYSQNYMISTSADTIATFDAVNVPSQVGSHFTMILNSESLGVGFALDNPDRGGRIVQLSGNCSTISTWQESIITDSVEWLCPKPKGRIAFDLSHQPKVGVDPWDELSEFPDEYKMFRDILVNHTFTFDKLYPKDTGNLTTARLSKYDVLILVAPNYNYTIAEVLAVQDYIYSGGSLFAFGHNPNIANFDEANEQLNSITEIAGLWVNNTLGTTVFAKLDAMEFFTLEGCSTLDISTRGWVNITDNAVALWGLWPDFNIASSYHGTGRIVLSASVGWIEDFHFVNDDNSHFAINCANWLTATFEEARVLVYQNGIGSGNNEYRSELLNALNELGIEFMFHTDPYYFNLSLFWEYWDIVIIDANSLSPVQYNNQILEYMENGGQLIMRDFYFYHAPYEIPYNLSLYTYLGFEGTDNNIQMGPPTVYLWEYNHGIFNHPIDYGSYNISSTTHWFGTDFCNVTLHDNATPLAGVTTYESITEAAIVESVEGRAICNFFALTEYNEDTDDSTYPDSYELWMNEIAYMMRPTIDTPDDRVIESGSVGEDIIWMPYSDRPYTYDIWIDWELYEERTWDGGIITVSLDDLDVGTYEIFVRAIDTAGYAGTDLVLVIVEDTTSPEFVDGPNNLQYQEGTAVHMLNWTFNELNPDSWVLFINGSIQDSGTWDGSEISADAGGLSEGYYNATIAVNDTSGNIATDTVNLEVTAPSTTGSTDTATSDTTTDTGTTEPPPDDNTMLIISIVALIGVVVVVSIVLMKRKKS